MATEQTIGQIAAAQPWAVRVFEKYQIDFCCGGARPLGEVCRERGLSAETVLAEVKDSAPRDGAGRDWASASLAELMGHVVATHHEYLRRELPLIEPRLEKVVGKHGPNYPTMLPALREVFFGLRDEIMAHLMKEERILFPAIEELESAREEGRTPFPPPFGTVNNPIRMMIFEHDNAGEALAEMRRLTQGYTPPPDACTTFRALYHELEQLEGDLHVHIHLENNILFPRAARLEAQMR